MPGIPREVAEHALDIRAGSRPAKQHLRRFDEEKRRAIGEEVQKLMAAGFIKEMRNTIPDCSDSTITAVFMKGVTNKDFIGKVMRKRPHDARQLFKIAEGYAAAEEAVLWQEKEEASTTTWPERGRSLSQSPKGAQEQPSGSKPGDKQPAPREDSDFHEPNAELNMIFGGASVYESKQRQKLTAREINTAVVITPQYLKWSEYLITFSREDHPGGVPEPGRHALVVAPTVGKVKLNRVLVDSGAGLNIIFARTLDDMKIPCSRIKPSVAPFHGIVSGKPAIPLRNIELPVTFGTRDKYRIETVNFEVADLETDYHAILGSLKNARATYQRCIQRCLHKQIGRNAEAYVDDIVVKSRTRNDLLVDPQETFDNLCEYRMKLNPEKKLQHYFQHHHITVVTSFPIGDIIRNRDIMGRVAKWATELRMFDIEYRPRTTIKSQALADFIAEWMEYQTPTPVEVYEYWTMFFDGSLKREGGGAGISLVIHGDSQLVVAQIMKDNDTVDPKMTAYCQEV
ncbi:uncharacterized protein [Miscanthus floridulus]|uniref:uncharacterized protein n=1 Tax=Miscanthus floridulus TaxID=154761 RepID=UPI0034591952